MTDRNILRAWKRAQTPEFDALWEEISRLLVNSHGIDLTDEAEDLGGKFAEMAELAFVAGYEAGQRAAKEAD